MDRYQEQQMVQKSSIFLQRQSAPTKLKWVKGHNEELENEQSNRLAKEGVEKEKVDEISLNIPNHFDLQGAKLAGITQAIAYKGIWEQEGKEERNMTCLNLEKVRGDIAEDHWKQTKPYGALSKKIQYTSR